MAAWLHDIGDFVSPSSHQEHSHYLIEHGEIMGLSAPERRFIALLARYHRRRPTSAKQLELGGMDPEEQRRFVWLAGILRVADALDRTHHQKVKSVRVRLEGGVIAIDLVADEDVSLELWTVGRKAALLEEAAGRRLVVGAG